VANAADRLVRMADGLVVGEERPRGPSLLDEAASWPAP
jgi:hypothetical protein